MPAFIVARDSLPEPAPGYANAIAEGFAALNAQQSNSLAWYVPEFAGTTDQLLERIRRFMDPAVGVAVLELKNKA
ncbi:hypothetical protein [Cupriavidus sp. RAF12]|uniref:hypothetical protein n=1 Tax=Cupriavidus sp. RAF12 TaxID=3233050 RepID=UPI003F9108CE